MEIRPALISQPVGLDCWGMFSCSFVLFPRLNAVWEMWQFAAAVHKGP